MSVKLVSQSFHHFICNSKKISIGMLKRLSIKYFLIHPKWMEIVQRFQCTDYPELCEELLNYQWRNYQSSWSVCLTIYEHHFIALVYGQLKRLKYFWSKIEHMQHPIQVLEFLAFFECNASIQFFVKNVPNLLPYINGRVESPLSVAARKGYQQTVLLLLPCYNKDNPDGSGMTAQQKAFENGHLEIAKLIDIWYN